MFYKDIRTGKEVSWNELIKDLNQTDTYNPFCFEEDIYKVFKNIIYSLLTGEEIILLDSNFSKTEILSLTGHSALNSFEKEVNKILFIESKNDLLSRLDKYKDEWSITLFTSGTSGIPKKIKHKYEGITRFLKLSTRHEKDVWGFAYNATHMAGIQVFFQGLANGNTIVNLFGLSPEMVSQAIEDNQITHISATPTFYRLFVLSEQKFFSVGRISSGGERLDENALKRLHSIFPNAKITNIYASTEAGTLLVADNNNFSVKDQMSKFVRIEKNELLIHRSLLGNTGIQEGDWYSTGDIVQVISVRPLKFSFVSRKNEMINVGGYKVNPNEVEEAIRNIKGIRNVRVFSKSNSVLGNIVCCEIESSKPMSESEIRRSLQSQLQEFKIPRIISFVDKISTTRTGKIKRK